MVVPSTGKENDYSWLSRFPKMREWIGDKVVKALAAFNYTIRNKDWEATVEVERNDIEDDQIMGYALQAKGAGQSAAELPADIVFALLSKGFTNLCYDGQPFFDTDHLSGGKSVSNKGTKKLAVTSLAAAKASYGAARTAMRSLKDDEGASLKIRPTIPVVPPALEDDANYLMTADRFPDNTPNPYKGTAEVLVVPELTSDTARFLLDTSKPVKPLIYQERKNRSLSSRPTTTLTTSLCARSSSSVLKPVQMVATASGRWRMAPPGRTHNADSNHCPPRWLSPSRHRPQREYCHRPDDHFSDSELQILENDPNLIVVRLQDVPENAGDGDAVSALTTERDGLRARVSELEATVLQLNRDGDALKQQLASANGTITELETVRDALSQKLDALQAGSENTDKKAKG